MVIPTKRERRPRLETAGNENLFSPMLPELKSGLPDAKHPLGADLPKDREEALRGLANHPKLSGCLSGLGHAGATMFRIAADCESAEYFGLF